VDEILPLAQPAAEHCPRHDAVAQRRQLLADIDGGTR
jgi:hypothetical protein